MVGEHDWGLLGQRHRDDAGGQLRETLGVQWGHVGVHGEGDIVDNIARELLESSVEQRKGDAGLGRGSDGPVARVVADGATVQGVSAAVVVGGNVVCVAVNGEGTVLDAIGIATNCGTEEGVVGLSVVQVGLGIIIADDDVLQGAIAVRHVQSHDASAIADERGGDILGGDVMDLEGVRSIRGGRAQGGQRQQRRGKIVLEMHSGDQGDSNDQKDQRVDCDKDSPQPRGVKQR